MDEPRVLVAAPTYRGKDYIFHQWYKIITNLSYKNYDWLVVDNSKGTSYQSKLRRQGYKKIIHLPRDTTSRRSIAHSTEYIRQYALDNGYDYIMMIETDIIVPVDIIQRLLNKNKDIIGGVYEVGVKGSTDAPRRICIQQPYQDNLLEFVEVEEGYKMLGQGIQQVGGMGLGCVLIKKNIFKEFPFKYTDRYSMHTDSIFYLDLKAKDIPVYVDTNLMLEHINQNWLWVKDR